MINTKLLAYLISFFCLISCHSYVTTSMDADLFEQTLNQTPNAQLVDVRTPEEFKQEHIPNAIMIDIKAETFEQLIQNLDRDRPVFVYCRSGKRSLQAANILEKNKFKTVYNLDGGIIAWKDKGKITVSEQ